MAEYPGLSSSVFAGSEASGARFPASTLRQTLRKPRIFAPTKPIGNPVIQQYGTGRTYPHAALPPVAAVAPVTATAPSITQTPKSQTQNQFLQHLQGTARAQQPAKQNALTQFVKEAYARQVAGKKALDSDLSAVDKVFAKDGGLASELVNSRAKRQASVLMRVRDAMNKARRANNVRRMFSGNNSYNDRAYADTLAGIAAQEAVSQSELEADDLKYLTGARTGLLGTRGRLGNDYLSSLMAPVRGINDYLRDESSVLGSIANLENQNSFYEMPADSYRRQIEEEEMRQRLQSLRY